VPPAAAAQCPSGCVCTTAEEAKKLGYQLCGGKQIICGYDQYQKPLYCYSKPAPSPPPPPCPTGCTCLTVDEAKNLGYQLCEGKQVVCGYDQFKRTKYCYSKPPAKPPPVTCPQGCVCTTAEEAKKLGYQLCGGKQIICGYNQYQNPMYCYIKPAPPPPARCPEGCKCLTVEDAKTLGYQLYQGKQMLCGYDQLNRPMYCFAGPTPPPPAPPSGPVDLEIRSVWLTPLGDGEYEIGYTIVNWGPGDVSASVTGLYMDDNLVAEDTVSSLSSGERRDEIFAWHYDMASCTPPRDTIGVIADHRGEIEETNEGNNKELRDWECPEQPPPDLVIVSGWWDFEVGPIQDIRIHYEIMNEGVGSAGPSVTELFINDEEIATSAVPELGGHSSQRLTFPRRWTPQWPDNHVRICADATNAVDERTRGELSERNNCWEADWTFPLSCCDGAQNRDEEGVDCGGTYCPPCNRCDLTTLPSRFDWRDYYTLPDIRDQGECKSCWAFAAVGAIEGTYIVECGTIEYLGTLGLSEQYVMCECPGGCDGGCPHDALSRARSSGIVDETCQPYLSADSPCTKCGDWSDRLWRITGYKRISSDISDIKRTLICYGPLSVGSESWLHAIVVVGYDDSMVWNDYDDGRLRGTYGPGVWIVRNQWGLDWGYDNDMDDIPDDPGYGLIPYSGHSWSDIKNYVHCVTGVLRP